MRDCGFTNSFCLQYSTRHHCLAPSASCSLFNILLSIPLSFFLGHLLPCHSLYTQTQPAVQHSFIPGPRLTPCLNRESWLHLIRFYLASAPFRLSLTRVVQTFRNATGLGTLTYTFGLFLVSSILNMGRFFSATALLAAIALPAIAQKCGGGSLCPKDSPCCSRMYLLSLLTYQRKTDIG